jgi:TetR/AcrR family transcriptional repressor of nem operon
MRPAECEIRSSDMGWLLELGVAQTLLQFFSGCNLMLTSNAAGIVDQSFTKGYPVDMGRPREFDEDYVLSQAHLLFAEQGYHGTSIDDVVNTTGLLRGSLYKAFGSKRNIFALALDRVIRDFTPSPENLDLVTVALKDLAPTDSKIRESCRAAIHGAETEFAVLLGKNLLAKAKEN